MTKEYKSYLIVFIVKIKNLCKYDFNFNITFILLIDGEVNELEMSQADNELSTGYQAGKNKNS